MEMWLLADAVCPARVDGLQGLSSWSCWAGPDRWLALLGAEGSSLSWFDSGQSGTSGFDMSVDPSIRGVLWGLLGLVRATAGVLGEAEQLSETGTRVESFVDAFSSPEDDWTSGFLWLCCSITVCNT